MQVFNHILSCLRFSFVLAMWIINEFEKMKSASTMHSIVYMNDQLMSEFPLVFFYSEY